MYLRIYVVITLICGLISDSYAQTDFYGTISNSRSRALGMGGAFIAMEGDITSASYNPATFDLNKVRVGNKLSIFINPVLPVVSFDQAQDFDFEGTKSLEKLLSSLQYVVKGVTFSSRLLDLGLILNEESIIVKDTGKFFNGSGFVDNYYHTAVASLKFSSQVSFGIAGNYVRSFRNIKAEEGLGLSYGLLIKPSNAYQVGITFFDSPKEAQNYRRKFERFAKESLNIGLALHLLRETTISIDVRNLTENDESASESNFGLQEFHFGVEFDRIKHLSLRAGYYREEFLESDNTEFNAPDPTVFSAEKHSNVFSLGVGFIDLNRFKSIRKQYNHPTPLLSYSLVVKDSPIGMANWHFLTVGFRIN